MMGWYGGMVPGMWWGMGLFWIVLVGAIVWLVVELAHPQRRGPAVEAPRYVPGAPDPLDVLDRRLATGDIAVDAYREARAALLESRRVQG